MADTASPIQSMDQAGMDLVRKLDMALGDYTRHFGRSRAIEKLTARVRAMQEAQRLLDAEHSDAG